MGNKLCGCNNTESELKESNVFNYSIMYIISFIVRLFSKCSKKFSISRTNRL